MLTTIDNQQHLVNLWTKVLLMLLMTINARLYFITMPRTLQRCKWSFLVLLLSIKLTVWLTEYDVTVCHLCPNTNNTLMSTHLCMGWAVIGRGSLRPVMIRWGEVDRCTSMTLMEPACQSVKYRRPDTSLYANRTAPLPAQTEQQRPSEKKTAFTFSFMHRKIWK